MGMTVRRRSRRDQARARLTTTSQTPSSPRVPPAASSQAGAGPHAEDLSAIVDSSLVHDVSVEERLRACFTLTEAIYQINELAREHHLVQVEGLSPKDISQHISFLTRALREQLQTVRGTLPFECLQCEAPPAMSEGGQS